MSLVPHSCPGCTYGGTHLVGCPNDTSQPKVIINNTVDLTKNSSYPGGCVPEGTYNKSIELPQEPAPINDKIFVTGLSIHRREPEVVEIEQTILPSTGTKLVCTDCGRQDWHTLILRRKAGLIEGLCKQKDGSGCYPIASRRNCSYTYPNQIDCPQVAEYCIALGKERLNPRQVCRDHIGEMLRQGPLYQVWPLED